jgi:hypothetical protein
MASHDTAARLILAVSLLPVLYFAVRDQVLHLSARRVSLAVLHLLLGLIFVGAVVRAFSFNERPVALGILAFAANALVRPRDSWAKFPVLRPSIAPP